MKKRNVKMLKIGGPEELLEFLQKLEKGDASEVEKLLEEQAVDVPAPEEEEEEEFCASPLCCHCMWRGGTADSDKVLDTIKDTLSLLEHEQLLLLASAVFGAAALCYETVDDEPNVRKLGRVMTTLVAAMARQNEKFAFATDPGNQGEGAKH